MKTTEKYEAPVVETIEVAVEKGFAGSTIEGQAVDEDMSGGGSIGVSW